MRGVDVRLLAAAAALTAVCLRRVCSKVSCGAHQSWYDAANEANAPITTRPERGAAHG